MTSVLTNFLYLGLGVLLGLPLGWMLSAMRYSKQARDAAYEIKRKMRDEHGWYTHKVSLIVALLFTAVAAVWTGIVNTKLTENKNCTEKVVTELVNVLQERTSLSTDLSIADSDQNRAFSTLMGAVLSQPQPKESQMRLIFQDYLEKLNTYLELQDKQRTAQVENPLPKEIDYRKCLDGE